MSDPLTDLLDDTQVTVHDGDLDEYVEEHTGDTDLTDDELDPELVGLVDLTQFRHETVEEI